MANLKLAYAPAVNLSISHANLASSLVNGWQSDGQDNTTNLYIDAFVVVSLAAVNTAPSNDQAIHVYAFGVADGSTTDYGGTGDGTVTGTEGTLVYQQTNFNTCISPLIGNIPYTVQNRALISPAFSIAAVFGGKLPAKYSIGMLNYSGMTLSVNYIRITPTYYTLA